MKLRRCAMLLIELDQQSRFEFATLLAGGDGLDRRPRWLAYAPHLETPVEVNVAEMAALETIAAQEWVLADTLREAHGAAVIDGLLAKALLLGDHAAHEALRACDERAHSIAWWPPAAIAQAQGGWSEIDIQARDERGLMMTSRQMVDAFGQAPPHEYLRRPGQSALPLARPGKTGFDALLAQRKTCRNFAADGQVSQADLAVMLHRVWGAIGTLELAPGAVAVKKNSPAGGGLHAVEAYVLAQRVEGLAPGLYHYLSLQHALEPMRAMDPAEAAAHAHRFVSGQHWFANVPVMVVMTARFDRLFWKYRRHAKAWRVVHLDVGHLSQTMYLSAADLGLGAFITAAINDRDIDRTLNLTALQESSIALVGFGPRAARKTTLELDDLTPTPANY